MDPLALVEGALAPLQRARDAIQGATDLKTSLRRRYGDYFSIIESLKSKPDVITANESERELRRLTELFTRVADLIGKYTAAPADGRLTKLNVKAKRAADYEDVNKELDEIDREVMRQLAIMNLKGTISPLKTEILQGVHKKVDRLTSLVNEMRPPSLPDMAAVPSGALALPRSYVERSGVQEVADGLINPEEPRAPYTVVGMGGRDKTVVTSAVVREHRVREYFRGGIFWVRVGRDANNGLLPLLQGVAREIGAAHTNTPHRMPRVLDSLEQVKQHLTAVASTGTSPRLVVLDDVWEREIVDALVPLGLKVLVTTRDRSVVGVPGGCLKLGDMTEEEALDLLIRTSGAVGRPGDDVRTQMTKVVARCGHLPLVLAIAGSMPVVKGKGLVAGAWEELINLFENVAKMMQARGEQSSSLNMVLEASFDALAARKQEEVLKMAVLAAGAVAPIEMLLNLWETKDTEGTREEAEGLLSKSLLQDMGGSGYRVHDLVLEFVKIKIKADAEMVTKATALQAQYLGRLDVLKSFRDPGHGAGFKGLFFLDVLWRSVEELSGNLELEVASYRASLGELESCEATEDVANSYGLVGILFKLQGKFTETTPLFESSQTILEKVFGPEHPKVATALNNRAGLLKAQGQYADAEPLFERCQAIEEKVLGPDHPSLARTLNNRAGLLEKQVRGTRFSLKTLEGSRVSVKHVPGGPFPRNTPLPDMQGNYAEAEPWYTRATEGKYAEAEPLYERCQAIQEKVLGADHPDLAAMLCNRAVLLESQGKYTEAEPLYKRCQAIEEKVLGPDHPSLARTLNNRAGLLEKQGKYDDAKPLYLRAIAVGEQALGPDHPDVAVWLNNLAGWFEEQGKSAEAEPLYERCQAIREQVLGPNHPSLATTLNNWALLLKKQGKYAEAEPLYERCQAIQEKVLGPDHPTLATTLNNRAELFKKQGKYDDAEPLYVRAITIGEQALGPDHPKLAVWLNNRAGLLEEQGKQTEAFPLLERAVSICRKKLGETHPSTVKTQISLERVRRRVGKQGTHEFEGHNASQGARYS